MPYKDSDKQKAYEATYRKNKPEVQLLGQRKYRNKVSSLIEEAKNKPCADCQGTFPSCVMDFDHRDRSTKAFNVSGAVRTRSIPEILLEIEKCDVVCANCHRIRTFLKSPTPGKQPNKLL